MTSDLLIEFGCGKRPRIRGKHCVLFDENRYSLEEAKQIILNEIPDANIQTIHIDLIAVKRDEWQKVIKPFESTAQKVVIRHFPWCVSFALSSGKQEFRKDMKEKFSVLFKAYELLKFGGTLHIQGVSEFKYHLLLAKLIGFTKFRISNSVRGGFRMTKRLTSKKKKPFMTYSGMSKANAMRKNEVQCEIQRLQTLFESLD